MNDATVILDRPEGSQTYSHQFVERLGPTAAHGRFCWHGGDREGLVQATNIRLIKSDGTLLGQGRLAAGTRPITRGDLRVEFELSVPATARPD